MNNYFSENLKKIRKDNNLSQEDLSEALGVSRQAISKWESGAAYPEMDKIIALCDKFNLNIDDLLHKDIREVKGEEIAKNNLSKYANDILKFIADTINMFCNMNFKSKVKCLFEEFVIGLVLYYISNLIRILFSGLLRPLPSNINNIVIDVFSPLYTIIIFIAAACIMIYIFKVRYLNYYLKVTENKSDDIKTEEDKSKKENKIEFNKEEKIIIRDPKHSEYRFVNAILKFFVFCIKMFVLFILFFVCLALVFIFFNFILSFLIIKSGLLFVGLLLSILAVGVIASIVIILLLNFIFNRKGNKKVLILSFVISLIILGIGCGTIFISSLDFDVIENPSEIEGINEIKNIKKDMRNNLYFNNYFVEFIESDIDDVRIEYEINKYCDLEYLDYGKDGVSLVSNCHNKMKMIKQVINGINDKKIILVDDQLYSVKVYASKKNIEIMKQNYHEYKY